MMQISKISITEQIYNILKEKILLQDYEIGKKINTKEIANEFNISVMPVRDALLQLDNQGLIVNKPRVGFFVRSFSKKEIIEIMEVRKMYEVYALENHFATINIKEIERINILMKDFGKDLTREKFDQIDTELHELIINASDNDFFIESYIKIEDLFVIFKHLNKDRMGNSHHEHLKLTESIISGNKEKSLDILKKHLDQVTDSIIQNIERKQKTG